MEEVTIVGQADRTHLARAGKWARFIAIVGFIGVGLGVTGLVAGMLIMFAAGAMPGVPLGPAMNSILVAYLVVALAVIAIYVIPLLYLYRFGSKAQAAARGEDAEAVSEALANLGRYFRFLGIVIIVGLCLYVVMIITLMVVVATTGAAAAVGA